MSEPGRPIVVLFALEREAAPFRRAARELNHVVIAVSGIGRRKARQAAEQVAAVSPGLIIAAGFCGALQPGLAVGEVICPREVVDRAGHAWPCFPFNKSQVGRLVTSSELIATRLEKANLGEQSGALAVDMESAAIAEVCAQRSAPFAAMRAVSDTIDTELSPQLVRLLAGGSVSVWRACRALVRRPSLLGGFRRLARDTRVAGKNLAEELLEALRNP